MDKTDINRMFPGYANGETTQRIAAAVFEALNGFEYEPSRSPAECPAVYGSHHRIIVYLMRPRFFIVSLRSSR